MTTAELDRLVEQFVIEVYIDAHYVVDLMEAYQRWQNFREAHGLPAWTALAESKETP